MLLDWHHCHYCKAMELREVEQVQQYDRIKINGLESILFLYTTNENLQRRQWHPTPVLLPRKSHGRRSRVGCSPRGR